MIQAWKDFWAAIASWFRSFNNAATIVEKYTSTGVKYAEQFEVEQEHKLEQLKLANAKALASAE